jgi:hypothetical protein
MQEKRLRIDGKVLCKGIQQAISRSEEPVLCLISPGRIRFVAVSGLRLVVSWETRLREPSPGNLAFLIPPLVADLLASEAICAQVGVEIALEGQTVTAHLADHLGSYEIRWHLDPASFPAPEAFSRLIQAPDALVEVSHLLFSDVTHQAVADLVRMEASEEVSPTKLAILIDVDFGRLRVDGKEIVTTAGRQYYFDPRLLIRALEFLRSRTLRVGISPLHDEQRGYLSLVSEEEPWTVQCSLVSIGSETQRLYPLPPGRNR